LRPSGYAPILDDDGKLLAVLGIDMTDINARNALADVTRMSIIIAAAGILLGLAAAFFMGIFMTRDLISLRKTVDLFGAGDFSVRSTIKVNTAVPLRGRTEGNELPGFRVSRRRRKCGRTGGTLPVPVNPDR